MPFEISFKWPWQAEQPNTENKLKVGSSNLIRKILSVDNESNITLKKALASLQFEWLLFHLDENFRGVQMGTKTKDEHDQYYKRLITRMQRLSLIYHSDKNTNKQEGVDGDAEQRLINQTIQALRKVHKQVITKHSGVYNRYYGIYRLYGELPVNVLNDDEDIYSVIKVSSLNGRSVLLDNLGALASYEEDSLMSSRNEYIKEAKGIVKCFNDISEVLREYEEEGMDTFAKEKAVEFDQRRNSEQYRCSTDWVHEVKIDLNKKGLEIIRQIIEVQKKAFNQYEKDYLESYNDYWVKPLEALSKNCQEDKELEVIKKAVEELYKESKEQQKILIGKESGLADSLFVQPILSYKNLVNVFYKFLIGVCDGIVKENEIFCDDLKSALYETGSDDEFVEESKEGIEKLSEIELLDFLNEMVNDHWYTNCNSSAKGKAKRVICYLFDENSDNAEMVHSIVLALKLVEKRFDDKFKKQETGFDRREKEERESKAKSEKLRRMLEEAEQRAELEAQRAEQEAQARINAEQRAEQVAKRAEQIKIVSTIFTKKVLKLTDEELRGRVVDNGDKIIEAVTGHVMEHSSHPGQVLDAIIGEITLNRGHVMKEGALIKEGRNFSNQGT